MSDETPDPAETAEPTAPVLTPPDRDAEIQEWKSYTRKHEKASKAAQARVAELETQIAEIQAASQSDHEKAIEQAKKEGAREARDTFVAQLRTERRDAAVARLAAGKFQNVDVALKLLDLDDAEIFDDDNTVKNDELEKALDDLLKREPYLSADPSAVGRPAGDADAGKGRAGSPADPAAQHNQELAALFGGG